MPKQISPDEQTGLVQENQIEPMIKNMKRNGYKIVRWDHSAIMLVATGNPGNYL